MKHQLIYFLDTGLEFLKREYVKRNSDSSFLEFTAQNYYDYILKDYIRRKIKSQIKIILNSSLQCIDYYKNDVVDADYLDEIVEQNWNSYAENDLSLLHSSNSHPGYVELQMISRLSFRVSIIQTTKIITCDDEKIKSYSELVKYAFPTKKLGKECLKAIFSMYSQMIDCFERNLSMINIAFYKPTFNLRDFQFTRLCYEFAISFTDAKLSEIYKE